MQRESAPSSSTMNANPERVRDSEPTAITHRRRSSRLGRIVALGLVVGLAGWIGVRVKTATEAQKAVAASRDLSAKQAQEKANAPLTVKSVFGTSETWAPKIPLEGTLAAVRESAVGFRVPGRVQSIKVKVGDKVKEGQVLGTLDASEASGQVVAAQAQLRAAQAQLALAEDAERRTSTMVASGGLPEAQGVQSKNEKALAAANADGAQARLDLARVQLSNHTVKAPFSGTVTKAPNGVGGVVMGNGSEFYVSDLSSLKLVGTIGEGDATLVHLGQPVEIATANGPVVGKVTSILGQVDAATRRVPVEAQVDSKSISNLFANSFVRASIGGGTPIQVVRLPRSVLRPGSQDEAFVVQNGVLQSRHIAFVNAGDGTILVRTGLTAEDEVLLTPAPETKEGDKVVVDKGNGK
jgi:RND family efflux transporter MFP subunit